MRFPSLTSVRSAVRWGRAGLVSGLGVLAVGACGSPAAGKLAAETAGALINGATSGSDRPPDFVGKGPYCDLWRSSDRACPALPDCSRLGSRRLSTNACVRDDRLLPVTSCLGDRWNGKQPRACQSGVFPGCAGLVEESCWEFDELVCLEPGGNKRLLECCVGARSDCVSNTYSLVEPRGAHSPPETLDAGQEASDASATDARVADPDLAD
ncbi:MAG: hypothetical protein KC766_29640 [Myxococcales bacterium]|nr:hypothetical protein [Myxococcales bacterium]